MTVWVKKVDGVSPSSAVSLDFREISAEDGPMWVSFDYWVHTADLTATGAIVGGVTYVDPTGNTILVPGTVCGLTDSTAKNGNNAVFAVQLFDGSSAWTFDLALAGGSAASALMSYRVMLQKDQCYVEW